MKIRTDVLSILIWVQTVCQGYHQIKKSLLAGKDLNNECRYLLKTVDVDGMNKIHILSRFL